MAMYSIIVTVNADPEVLDEYIGHVKAFNYYFVKRKESNDYRCKAMECHEKMLTIERNLGRNVLTALERLTGKSIPLEQ